MAISELFDTRKQLTFYGSYHSHPINIIIHVIFVPAIMWSAQVLLCDLPSPAFLPQIHYTLTDYLKFEFTYGTVQGLLWLAYYYILDPLGAILYTPQAILSILTANAFAQRANHTNIAAIVHVASWIFQILGHKFAEGRSPALLDNPVNAMYKQLKNDVGVEITKFRKIEGDKKRAAEKRTD
ncbi:hypothetical protein BGY98DRAFT_1087296 [Russula aff. rugulosa BPL654]|nr:hypothetical protein BGY98DRAFT_1087296 [Russula aff. rugulosa BPL654]